MAGTKGYDKEVVLLTLVCLLSAWRLITLTPYTGQDFTANDCASAYDAEDACIRNAFCGWCSSSSTCTEGGFDGPFTGTCDADSWKYLYTRKVLKSVPRESAWNLRRMESRGVDRQRFIVGPARVAEDGQGLEVSAKPKTSGDSDKDFFAVPGLITNLTQATFPASQCKGFINGTLILTTVEGEHNYWHMHTDALMNIWLVADELGAVADPYSHIALMEGHNPTLLRKWAPAVSPNPIRYLKDIHPGVCFSRVLFKEPRFGVALADANLRNQRNGVVAGHYAARLRRHFLGSDYVRFPLLRPRVVPESMSVSDGRMVVTILQRGGKYNRRILNAGALAEGIRKHFKIGIPLTVQVYNPDGQTAYQQARVFSETDVLIGVRGAGLTNMLFMPAGAMTVEVLPATLPEGGLQFSELSRCLKLHPRGFYAAQERSYPNPDLHNEQNNKDALKTLGYTREQFTSQVFDLMVEFENKKTFSTRDRGRYTAFDWLYMNMQQHQDVRIAYQEVQPFLEEARTVMLRELVLAHRKRDPAFAAALEAEVKGDL